jgi:TolA-binding protein
MTRNYSMAVLSLLAVGTLAAQQPAPKPVPVPKIKPKIMIEPFEFDLQFVEDLNTKLQIEMPRLQGRIQELRALELGKLHDLRAIEFDQLHELGWQLGDLGSKIATEIRADQIARIAEQASLQVQDHLKHAVAMPIDVKLNQKFKLDQWSSEFPLLDKSGWARPTQGTPEDSLYRSAREALNRGEYGRAASLFQSLEQKYPKSRFAPTALYYQSFALYRSGSTENLRTALETLKAMHEKYPEKAADPDVGVLRTRVNAALAARGDATAAAALRAATSSGRAATRKTWRCAPRRSTP